MTIYDLILVCGSNLKPLHSGEKIAVWVQILSFRWRCYRQDLTPGYSFLHFLHKIRSSLHIRNLMFARLVFACCADIKHRVANIFDKRGGCS